MGAPGLDYIKSPTLIVSAAARDLTKKIKSLPVAVRCLMGNTIVSGIAALCLKGRARKISIGIMATSALLAIVFTVAEKFIDQYKARKSLPLPPGATPA